MIAMFIELSVVAVWSFLLGAQVRRLFRLAAVRLIQIRGGQIRSQLVRVWWWLGREEFWDGVQRDGVICVQLTLMLFLFGWGLPV